MNISEHRVKPWRSRVLALFAVPWGTRHLTALLSAHGVEHLLPRLAALLSASGIAILFLMVAVSALPLLTGGGEGSPWGWQWRPDAGQCGILPMLCATVLLSLSSLAVAWPLALGLCCRLHCGGPAPSRGLRLLGALLRGMSAVPTVTYGFAALFLLTPLLRRALGGTGLCWFGAALMLALLILPTLTLVLDAGLRPRMERLRPLGAALGLPPVRVWLFLALPDAKRTALSALVLACGRAAGDTLLPLMLAGNAPQLPLTLTDSVRALTAHMALVTANEAGGAAYNSLFAAGAFLLLFNAGMSLLARHLQRDTQAEAEGTAHGVEAAFFLKESAAGGHAFVVPDAEKQRQRDACACGDALARPDTEEQRQTASFTGRGGSVVRVHAEVNRECASGSEAPSPRAQKRCGPRAIALRAALMLWGSRIAPLVLCAVTGALGFFLLEHGLPAIDASLFFGETPAWAALTGRQPVWDGIWPACAGTLGLVCLSMALALFPGLGCGVYLAECATPRQRRWLGCAADMLAGTPSIVMGLFGFTLILFLRRTLLPQANTCLLLAAACLALLVLPVLITAAREALEAVPQELRVTAAALGLTAGQRLRHVLLPAAKRGMGGGVVLALGRAAEDTAVIMLTGAVANAGLPAGLLAKFEALPFYIYYTAAEYQNDMELARGFGASLLLLGLSCGLLLAARGLMRSR